MTPTRAQVEAWKRDAEAEVLPMLLFGRDALLDLLQERERLRGLLRRALDAYPLAAELWCEIDATLGGDE